MSSIVRLVTEAIALEARFHELGQLTYNGKYVEELISRRNSLKMNLISKLQVLIDNLQQKLDAYKTDSY